METHIQKIQDEAIEAALANNWTEAVELNKQILKLQTDNLDAHLALGFAYLQQANFKESRKFYRKSLKLDPTNLIAQNNLEKIRIIEKKGVKGKKGSFHGVVVDPNTFITVAGKTKLTSLTNIGQAQVLAKLKAGEGVLFQIKKRRVEIRNTHGEYIGALPDDLSKRLMFFLQAGSIYSIFINSASKNNVDVFIREDKKGRQVSHFISFPKNIQDDLKVIMGQIEDDDDEEEGQKKDGEAEDEDDDIELNEDSLDLDDVVEDLEDQKENYISDLEDEDDDDEFEE